MFLFLLYCQCLLEYVVVLDIMLITTIDKQVSITRKEHNPRLQEEKQTTYCYNTIDVKHSIQLCLSLSLSLSLSLRLTIAEVEMKPRTTVKTRT